MRYISTSGSPRFFFFSRQTWRHAYQKQVQETELLKREGGDTALAGQWRQRYEKLSLEKVPFFVTFWYLFFDTSLFAQWRQRYEKLSLEKAPFFVTF